MRHIGLPVAADAAAVVAEHMGILAVAAVGEQHYLAERQDLVLESVFAEVEAPEESVGSEDSVASHPGASVEQDRLVR